MRTKKLEVTMAMLTPAIVGYRDELHYIHPEKMAKEGISHFQKGGAEMILILKLAIISLNILSLITHGRLLKNMEKEKLGIFLEKSAGSRFLLVRGIVMIIKLPIIQHYYAQDEVCLALGYNREELCADADKHQVTR